MDERRRMLEIKASSLFKMISKIQPFSIPVAATIRQAIACIDQNEKGIALIIDHDQKLVGTISDGDVRRAWLSGQNLDEPIRALLSKKSGSRYPKPITASLGTPSAKILEIMKKNVIRQLPLLDSEGRVAGLVTYEELVPDQALPVQVVVMAGGYGKRLYPLTKKTPKPMLPIGKRPMLELIVKQLRKAGVREVNISTHYQAHKISKHFKDGRDFDVHVQYLKEEEPLGTAGALGLMPPSNKPTLIVNGDVLARVNYRAMLAFHEEHKADVTVAVQKYDVEIAYGVLETEGADVKRIVEKPKQLYLINAGIYLIQPSVHGLIAKDQRLDMPELIQKVLDTKGRVVSFPVREYWLDIGSHANYRQAKGDAKKGKLK